MMDDDYFLLSVPGGVDLRRPTVSVQDADAPVEVTLYDAAHTVIGSWPNCHEMSTRPPRGITCYLKVSGRVPTMVVSRPSSQVDLVPISLLST